MFHISSLKVITFDASWRHFRIMSLSTLCWICAWVVIVPNLFASVCQTGWYIYINPSTALFINLFKKSRTCIFWNAIPYRNFAFKSKWQKFLANSFRENIKHYLRLYYIDLSRMIFAPDSMMQHTNYLF